MFEWFAREPVRQLWELKFLEARAFPDCFIGIVHSFYILASEWIYMKREMRIYLADCIKTCLCMYKYVYVHSCFKVVEFMHTAPFWFFPPCLRTIKGVSSWLGPRGPPRAEHGSDKYAGGAGIPHLAAFQSSLSFFPSISYYFTTLHAAVNVYKNRAFFLFTTIYILIQAFNYLNLTLFLIFPFSFFVFLSTYRNAFNMRSNFTIEIPVFIPKLDNHLINLNVLCNTQNKFSFF